MPRCAAVLSAFAVISMLVPSQVDVVVSRRIDVSVDRGELVARDLSRALVVAKMDGVRAPDETLSLLKQRGAPDPASCGARRPCVAQLGAVLQSVVIVSIDLGQVARRLAVSLTAITPSNGAPVLTAAFTVPLNGGEVEFARGLDDFALKLSGKVEKKAVAPDAPVQRELTPAIVEAADRPVPVGAKISAGGAIVTGAAAITFGALGIAAASSLSSASYVSAAGPASRLTRPEADALASSANTRYAIAGGCLAATAVLTGVALYLWNAH